MKASSIYSSNMAVTLGRKIMELKTANVEWEITLRRGIANELVVRLDWDQSALEKYYEDIDKT